MPWTCRLVAMPTTEDKQTPGVLYYAPWYRQSGRLSAQYSRDWAHLRDPIMLVIPSYGTICVDSAYYPETPGHDGWTVTGTAPTITVHPSLGIGQDMNGRWIYHGWLKDGVLSDPLPDSAMLARAR